MGTGTTSDADCACQGDEKNLSLFPDTKRRVKGELPACRLYDNVTTVHRAQKVYEQIKIHAKQREFIRRNLFFTFVHKNGPCEGASHQWVHLKFSKLKFIFYNV